MLYLVHDFKRQKFFYFMVTEIGKEADSMTLQQLKYFQTIARLQHFHNAATELNISQPSLSRSMASLEQELNIILFEKRGRNIVLTKAGYIFLEHVNQILEEIHITEKKMHELANSEGHINIAYVYPLANYHIPHMVRSFLNENPGRNITFQFNQTYTEPMIEGLKNNKYDVIFCSSVDNEPEIHFTPILKQEMVIITPKGHPLTQHTSVSSRELCNYTFIGYERYSGLGRFTRNFFKEQQLPVHILCECPDENSIAALVAENFGIALVANVDTIHQSNVEMRPLSDIELTHTVHMGYLKNRYQIPVIKEFIQFIKKSVSS